MRLLFLLTFQLIICSTYANGGPVDGSSVFSAGEVQSLDMPDVELLKERLHIEIEGDYCFVKVEYTLRNTYSQGSEDVKYGFPIDYVRNEYDGDFTFTDDDIKDLRFALSGKNLPWSAQDDFSLFVSEHMFNGNAMEIQTKRKWFFTSFSIKPDETVSLSVSYRIRSGFTDIATSKSFLTYFGDKSLYWDFLPAQYWGNGIVGDFEALITIKNGGIDKGSLKIEGLPFAEKDAVFSYRSNSFNLSQAEPLLLRYTNVSGSAARFIKSANITNAKLPLKITASSHQEKYPAKYAFDGDYTTAWVPARGGIGEWIEISPDKPFYLGALLIVGGYTKSKETYYNNNRLKKIKVEYMKKYDEAEEDEKGEFTIDFPDVPFPEDIPAFLYSDESRSFLTDFGDMSFGMLSKMRITVLDVYKGEKYNDTCISEISALGYYPDDIVGE